MPPFRNKLLCELEEPIIRRLDPRPIQLEARHEIEFPGEPLRNLFFIEEGIASMTATFLDGSQVEVGICGPESVLGASCLTGTRRSLNRVYMQVAGAGYLVGRDRAIAEFKRGEIFHDLCLCYLQAQFIQSAQTAACNARHSVTQRLARWLLLCSDRVGAQTFNIAQEFIADMLGASRPTISVAASEFQHQELIRYRRGTIEILNHQGLEARSCECYRTVRDYLNNFYRAFKE